MYSSGMSGHNCGEMGIESHSPCRVQKKKNSAARRTETMRTLDQKLQGEAANQSEVQK